MTRADTQERRYTQGGKVAHVVRPNPFDHTVLVSRCGIGMTLGWYGTGSQDEYERVASLPLCRRCETAS